MCILAVQLWNIYMFWESHKSTAFSYLAKLFANVFQEGFVVLFFFYHFSHVCHVTCMCLLHGFVCVGVSACGMHVFVCMGLSVLICV